MARLFRNFLGGPIDNAPLTDTGTTLSGPFLEAFPVVAAPDVMRVTLDPDGVHGIPEIVTITAHTVSAPTATITRGPNNREHPAGTFAKHAITADDLEAFRDEADPIGSGDVDNTVATRTGTNTGNRIHVGATAPGSPVNGDIWVSLQAGFRRVAVWINGVWETIAS